MASHRRTRLNVLIDDYFLTIAVVLVVIAAGGAWATYTTAVEPGSHAEQRIVSSWGVSGGFNYSATAVNATPIFDRGTVRAGRKFYFTNAMPVLDGRFGFGFDGATGDATVTTRTTLVNYAVYAQSGIGGQSGFTSQAGARNRSDTRIWELTAPLGTDRERVETGETATTAFAVDVSDIQERVRRINQILGPISQVTDVRTSVAVTVNVNGTIGGERVQRSFNYTLPVNSSTGYYVVYPPQKPDTREFSVTRSVTVPNDYGILTILASFVGLILPLVALAGLFYGRENDWFEASQTALVDAQRAKLRAEFEEWVTLGTVAANDDRTTVTVNSLEGLVDVAIDSDRRVVEDDETGMYVVLDDDVRYQFTPEWGIGSDDETTAEGRNDRFEADTSADDSRDIAASAPAQSDDGDSGADEDGGTDERPTAFVELLDSRVEDEQGEGIESGHEGTDGHSTDSSGAIDRLQSTIKSTLGGSSASSETVDESDDEPSLTEIDHVGEARAATLRDAGFRTVADVRGASPAELQEIGNIGARRAEQMRDSAAGIVENAESESASDGKSASTNAEDERHDSDS